MYVPLAFAVQVPFTWSSPEIDVVLHVRGSRPTSEMSRAPLSDTHDDVTFQVPTTSPPQAVPAAHDGPPLVPALPLLELPPVPVGLPGLDEQASITVPNMTATPRTANRTFIEQSPSRDLSPPGWIEIPSWRAVLIFCDLSFHVAQLGYLPYPAATMFAWTLFSV